MILIVSGWSFANEAGLPGAGSIVPAGQHLRQALLRLHAQPPIWLAFQPKTMHWRFCFIEPLVNASALHASEPISIRPFGEEFEPADRWLGFEGLDVSDDEVVHFLRWHRC